jgi:hypothetical protein
MTNPEPPLYDPELERAVLDCCMEAPDQIPLVRSLLRPSAFYVSVHRSVYSATLDAYDAGERSDVMTLAQRLQARGAPDNGLSWRTILVDLLGAAPVWLNAPRYAADLARLAHHRELANAGRLLALQPDDPEHQQRLAALLAEPPLLAPGASFALDLDAFIAERSELPVALVGDDDDVLLPHAGLLIEFAKGGRGKTTLTIELAFHCASAMTWLGFPIRRPLRVLFIENEGPRESFRAKLERKRRAWPHRMDGALFIQSMSWGALSLQDATHLAQLRRFVEAEKIDLVIGDPLDSLGLAGVGSPQDTREFMALLQRVGLFRDVAFILLAHPRKELTSDELDEIAGAWGGRPDTMLRLAREPANRARLSFPKFRWSRSSEQPAMILSFDPRTDSFALVHRETPSLVERDYVAEITALLTANPWRTAKEISQTPEKGGIGANVDLVKALLDNPTAGFVRQPGRLVGRHPSAVCWSVTKSGDSGLGVTRVTMRPEQEEE